MKGDRFFYAILSLLTLGMLMCLVNVEAFDTITAQEAYDMVSSSQASIIDVRTLEEHLFVGGPALVPGGDPIAYLIPWKIFKGMNADDASSVADYLETNKLYRT